MTAKLQDNSNHSLISLRKQIPRLQARVDRRSEALAKVAKSSLRTFEPCQAQDTVAVLRRFSKRLGDLQRQLSPSKSSTSRASLTYTATLYLHALYAQCDVILNNVSSKDKDFILQTASLRIISSTTAIALQCLQHDHLLFEMPDIINLEQQMQASQSRLRLQQRVSKQQLEVQSLLICIEPVASIKRHIAVTSLDYHMLLSLLHPDLSAGDNWKHADLHQPHWDRAMEAWTQQVLLAWVSRARVQAPVVFSRLPRTVESPQWPAHVHPSMLAAHEAHGQAQGSRPVAVPQSTQLPIRRHSTTGTSPTSPTMRTPPRYSVSDPFGAASYPPASLRDPPFVVTQGRTSSQAYMNAQAQAEIQAQAQAQKQSQRHLRHDFTKDSGKQYAAKHRPKPAASSPVQRSSTTYTYEVEDDSSASSSDSRQYRPLLWRLTANGQTWTFENNQLVHNTGSSPPDLEAARRDRRATTYIPMKKLPAEVLAAYLERTGRFFDVVERKVTNGDRSKYKKFVAINAAMGWKEVETLVLRQPMGRDGW